MTTETSAARYVTVPAGDGEVREYDLASFRLLPDLVVDPREPGERMRGMPITRATTRNGRWECTL